MELLPTKALSGSGCQNACQSKPRRQRTEKKAKKRVQKDAESGPEKAAHENTGTLPIEAEFNRC